MRVPLLLSATLAAAAVAVMPATGRAATITAPSCGQADVQAAVDQAQDGDTVQLPEGECTWSAPVAIGTITSWQPLTYAGKRITFQGAGIDRTIIRAELDPSEDLLVVVGEAGKPVRVTGLTLKGGKNVDRCQRAIVIDGEAEGWRIDHVKIDYLDVTETAPGCGIGASGVGVIDHCDFENVYTAVASFGDGDGSWERPLALGSAEAVYIEDNLMSNTEIVGDGATDAYGGARYVFRHNTVINARAGHHGLDSGGYRSPHSFEIYDNSFEWTVPNSWYSWRSRGGTGVIFGNTIAGDASETATFGVVNYRTCCCHWCTAVTPEAYGETCDPFVACAEPLHENCGTWGRCDGTSPIDGNTEGGMGYPCMDQTGRSTDGDGDGLQDLEPLYEWDDTVNGNDADVTVNDPWGCANPSMADHIQENRDFYNDTPRPGYVPYTYPHPLATDEPAATLETGDDSSGCGCRITGPSRPTRGYGALGVGAALLVAGRMRCTRRRAVTDAAIASRCRQRAA